MQKYLDKITPNVSDVWRADELFLKVKGNNKYLFAFMDDETTIDSGYLSKGRIERIQQTLNHFSEKVNRLQVKDPAS